MSGDRSLRNGSAPPPEGSVLGKPVLVLRSGGRGGEGGRKITYIYAFTVTGKTRKAHIIT